MVLPPSSISARHPRKLCIFGLIGNIPPPVYVNMLGGSSPVVGADGVRMVKNASAGAQARHHHGPPHDYCFLISLSNVSQ